MSGSDQNSDFDDSDRDEPALNGSIVVVVTLEIDELNEAIQEFLKEFGGGEVTVAD